MTRTAVLICPGRGTYNKSELGYLHRFHADKAALLADFDAQRREAGQEEVTALDGATRFSVSKYSRGDIASPLIYASALADARSLADDIEVGRSYRQFDGLVHRTGRCRSAERGRRVPSGEHHGHADAGAADRWPTGLHPFAKADWQNDPARKAELLALAAEIDVREGHDLALSIDLGGMLVLAGNEAGLAAFEAAVPVVDDRFPMRLANHAAFHTSLQAPVAAEGRKRLGAELFRQPQVPLIDGRGQIWWPGAADTQALWDYTLGHQVVEPYGFTRAVQNAACEFAPDLFIVVGPGTTLGGAVAQSLVHCGWQGMTTKADFKTRQTETPLLVSMGDADQRGLVTS